MPLAIACFRSLASDMLPDGKGRGLEMTALLTKRALDAAEPKLTGEYFVWCGKLPGFGVRIYPTGRKVFIAQIRIGRKQRRVKIGSYGALTVEQARDRAREIIQAAADGRDPQREKQEARQAITVAELCEEYLRGGSGRARHDALRPSEAARNGGDRSRPDRPPYRAADRRSSRPEFCAAPMCSAWSMP